MSHKNILPHGTPIVVLGDLETWDADLEACSIMFVSESDFEELDAGMEPDKLDRMPPCIPIKTLLDAYCTLQRMQQKAS